MSQIVDFYAERSIFLTGATGFLGKVLLEKLIRSVPNIGRIYVLIRPQTGCDAKERLHNFLKNKLFDQIRLECSERLDRIVPMDGNLTSQDLGLSQLDMHTLLEEVSVVFHCAATVKFDEALKTSVDLNVVGTQRLVTLCHKMRNLVVFVHASTAYANCDRSKVQETIYAPPIAPQKLIDSLDWMSTDMVTSITKQLVGSRPNTYTFTKALAEFLVAEESGNLPVVIVRPSIIGSVWKEPLPGWIDNLNGPTGLFAAVGKGLLRSMLGSNEGIADIIPVDVVSNLMICAGHHVSRLKKEQRTPVPVINCCSGQLKPVTWGKITQALEKNFTEYPFNEVVCIPRPHLTRSRLWRDFNMFLNHLLPAYALDLISALCGRKPRMVRIYDKLLRAVSTFEYFTLNSWEFESGRLLEVWEGMSPVDQKIFNFDVRSLDWDKYLQTYCLGIKKYLMCEEMLQVGEARKRFQRLKLWINVLNIAFYGMLLKMIIATSRSKNIVQFLKQMWFAIVLLVNRLLFLIPGFHKLVPHSMKWSIGSS